MTTPAQGAVATVATPEPLSITLYMRCVENDVHHGYDTPDNGHDGGKVVLMAARGQLPDVAAELLDARTVIVVKHNEILQLFPQTRDEKQTTFFEVTVRQVPFDQVPADPDAPKVDLYDAQGRKRNPNGTLVIPIQMRPKTA